MSAEWKPGDVAVDGGGNRLMCAERADGSLVWMNVFGGFYPIGGLIEDARPLVVIDPGEEAAPSRSTGRTSLPSACCPRA